LIRPDLSPAPVTVGIGYDPLQGGHVIETENLQLIPCEASHLATVLEDKKGLEPLLGVSVPESWPVFPEAVPRIYEKLRSDPSAVGWWSYIFVHTDDRTLAGDGGFKGRPNGAGEVEIGHALVPEYRPGGSRPRPPGASSGGPSRTPRSRRSGPRRFATGTPRSGSWKSSG
jgi:hypothetical protein